MVMISKSITLMDLTLEQQIVFQTVSSHLPWMSNRYLQTNLTKIESGSLSPMWPKLTTFSHSHIHLSYGNSTVLVAWSKIQVIIHSSLSYFISNLSANLDSSTLKIYFLSDHFQFPKQLSCLCKPHLFKLKLL